MKIVMFVTDACSLCDQALDIMFGMPELTGYVLETVDIATDDSLLKQFGESIPVLELADRRLFWPFTEGDIRNLVQTASLHSVE
ncbi:MAG: glutaredoxin family protein [Gammaproteobacteria bacterium]|nr:glutaredoxin family protein [Gammaproteobacteria bacterium]MYF01889.1 glutaredoxin family protein [Gammaproteobacteria bacterium]MYI77267.1 glutaredoxin family protein [Gammaproteobacteria bacterium]